MTPKQRVQAALRRQMPDRVPIFMWFHPDTAARLAMLLEVHPDQVGLAMGNDVQQAWVNNNFAMEGVVHQHDGEGHTDAWGIRWVKEGPFNQIAEFPLAMALPGELLEYRFPYDHIPELLAPMQAVLVSQKRHFIGCDVSPCAFEMYCRLRGMEAAMLDMAAAPELARELLGRCADFAVELAHRACEQFPLDWLWTGDDVAGQQSMMMSPAAWRDLVGPQLQRVFHVGKRRGLWIAYHSCGAVSEIIPDLIEMGLDVLNPVQGNCPGMDPLELKRQFGHQLAFMGGVDTQNLLPHGSAIEVARATERLLQGMTADGGGYILAASHTIPPDTPDENIFAMYEVAGLRREEIFDRAAALRQQS